jgi:hypothetical protein
VQVKRSRSGRFSLLDAEARTKKDVGSMRLPLFGLARAMGIEVYLAASCFERGIERRSTRTTIATIAVVRETVELAHEQPGSGAFLSVEMADCTDGVSPTALSNCMSVLQAGRLKERRRRAARLRYEMADGTSEELAAAAAANRAVAELMKELTAPLPVGNSPVLVTGVPTEFATVRMGDLVVARHLGTDYSLTVRSDGWPELDQLALVRVTDSHRYLEGRMRRPPGS